MTQSDNSDMQPEPLIGNRLLGWIIAGLVVMAIGTLAITFGGRWLGSHLAIGGHTDSLDTYVIRIGQDDLRLAANTIRFDEQRHDGPSERVDLYLAWPQMQGYSTALRRRFDDSTGGDGLIFLQVSQSTMSRDMSGRVEPIYSHLFDGAGIAGPHGLILHKLKADSGFGDEVVLTAPGKDGLTEYAVRCHLPDGAPGVASAALPNSADCQRDIHAGQDLTVLYRFSSALLSDWNHIDAAIARFVQERIVTAKAGGNR